MHKLISHTYTLKLSSDCYWQQYISMKTQAATKSGKERIQIVSKNKKLDQCRKQMVSYCMHAKILLEYADALLLKTIELCTFETDKPELATAPSPLASQYNPPDKLPYFPDIHIYNAHFSKR